MFVSTDITGLKRELFLGRNTFVVCHWEIKSVDISVRAVSRGVTLFKVNTALKSSIYLSSLMDCPLSIL
jgi:hypothetical protein